MKEDIVTLIKSIKKNSGLSNREIAAKMGITEKRMSTLTSQGDMKLSNFIKLLEITGMQMEISPAIDELVSIRVCQKNKCNECAYKKIAETVDTADVHLDEQTSRLVIEV